MANISSYKSCWQQAPLLWPGENGTLVFLSILSKSYTNQDKNKEQIPIKEHFKYLSFLQTTIKDQQNKQPVSQSVMRHEY